MNVVLLYWLLACVPVMWCMHRFPPRCRDDRHFLLAIAFAWLIWPIAVLHLWSRRHLTTAEFVYKRRHEDEEEVL